MAFKLMLSIHLDDLTDSVYKAFSIVVDVWFYAFRGYKDPKIDHCKLALYVRKLIATNIGVKKSKTKDKGRMDHTKTLLKVKNGLTKFSCHTLWHLVMDVITWCNLHLAQCKTLEKTNTNTKQAAFKGNLKDNLCNRIMKYRVDLFKLVYLCEGNGVTDDGKMDPINGQNKLDQNAINSLKDYKWFSSFLHEKLNPTKPEYCDGSMVHRKIDDNHDDLKFISPLNGQCFEEKMTEAIWEKVDYVEKSNVNYFQQLNYWRNRKKSVVGKGCLLARIIEKYWNLMWVLLIARVNENTRYEETIVIGHEVIFIKPNPKDTNAAGRILSTIVCWQVSEIYSNVKYYHFCKERCKEKNGLIDHDWNRTRKIVIFGNLGMGKKTIQNPLIDNYGVDDFHYPPEMIC